MRVHLWTAYFEHNVYGREWWFLENITYFEMFERIPLGDCTAIFFCSPGVTMIFSLFILRSPRHMLNNQRQIFICTLKLIFQKGALRHLESADCDNLSCWGNNNNTITITYQFLRHCVKINYHLPRWRRDRSSPIFTLWKMIKLFLIPLKGCGRLPTPRALSCESWTKYAHKSSKTHSLLIRILTNIRLCQQWS